MARSRTPAGRWQRCSVLPTARSPQSPGNRSCCSPNLRGTTGLQTHLQIGSHVLLSSPTSTETTENTHKYSQNDGRVVAFATGCVNVGWPNMHVTFCPSYTEAGRKYELVCVSQSASSSLCGSSSEFSASEISVSGLPPDETQETTQNSLPPFWTISASTDTFGVAAEQTLQCYTFTQTNVSTSKFKSQKSH